MNFKQFVPAHLRLRWKLLKRHFIDWTNRHKWRFARQRRPERKWPVALEVSQPIRPSPLYENKIHNLQLGSQRVAEIIICPQEVFSFWRVVGPPTSRNGFRKGRNLIGGELKEDYGGGLCQLSGLIYYLSLQAGLEILERFSHSLDIYTDASRFAPLGSDATVVYGYKDLRVRNVLTQPIRFNFRFGASQITASIQAAGEIVRHEIEFIRRKETETTTEVDTMVNGELIGQSHYKKL